MFCLINTNTNRIINAIVPDPFLLEGHACPRCCPRRCPRTSLSSLVLVRVQHPPQQCRLTSMHSLCCRAHHHNPAPPITSSRSAPQRHTPSAVPLLRQSRTAASLQNAPAGHSIQPAWPPCLKPTHTRPACGPRCSFVYAKGRKK
jgi:hypothetical protein